MVNKIKIEYENGIIIEGITDNAIKCTITKKLINKINLQIEDFNNKEKKAQNIFDFIIVNSKKDLNFIPKKYPITIYIKSINNEKINIIIKED